MTHWQGAKIVSTHHQCFCTAKAYHTASGEACCPTALLINEPPANSHSTPVGPFTVCQCAATHWLEITGLEHPLCCPAGSTELNAGNPSSVAGGEQIGQYCWQHNAPYQHPLPPLTVRIILGTVWFSKHLCIAIASRNGSCCTYHSPSQLCGITGQSCASDLKVLSL